jgi:hypothetical protein
MGTGYGVLEVFRGLVGSRLITYKTVEYYFKCFLRMWELKRGDNVGIILVVVVIRAVLYLYVGMSSYNTTLYRWSLDVVDSLLYINVVSQFGVGLSIGNVQVTRTLFSLPLLGPGRDMSLEQAVREYWTAWSVVAIPMKRVARQILKESMRAAMLALGLLDLEPVLLA